MPNVSLLLYRVEVFRVFSFFLFFSFFSPQSTKVIMREINNFYNFTAYSSYYFMHSFLRWIVRLISKESWGEPAELQE